MSVCSNTSNFNCAHGKTRIRYVLVDKAICDHNLDLCIAEVITNVASLFYRLPLIFIHKLLLLLILFIYKSDAVNHIEHIDRLARMSILDTEVEGSNPGSSMLFP